VDEDVATTHFLQKNQFGAVVEKIDKLERLHAIQLH
jgi:hypothetical protein